MFRVTKVDNHCDDITNEYPATCALEIPLKNHIFLPWRLELGPPEALYHLLSDLICTGEVCDWIYTAKTE